MVVILEETLNMYSQQKVFKRVDEIPELRYNLLNYMNEYNIKALKGR
jgi:hypothetical protein